MEPIRRRLRLFSLAAFVAMFALALAPSVSRAVAAAAGFDPLAEICTGSGVVGAGDTGAAAGAVDHCPLCALPALLPASAPDLVADVPAAHLAVPARPAPPRALRPWTHAPPRAPPARFC